jgi:hypothetical protein
MISIARLNNGDPVIGADEEIKIGVDVEEGLGLA